MTKSKAKGGKNRRKCKRSKFQTDTNDHVEFKEINQDYAKVLERKGGNVVTLKLTDMKEVLGIIRGRMKKRVWISSGDIVLVSLREFQSNKVDILMKYKDEHVRKLVQYGEITRQFADKNDKSFFDNGELQEELNIEFINPDEI